MPRLSLLHATGLVNDLFTIVGELTYRLVKTIGLAVDLFTVQGKLPVG